MSAELPFRGREKEIACLEQLHAGRKHVLVLGPAGVGKSALLHQAGNLLPLLICPQSARLTDICASLEGRLGVETTGQRLASRKNRLPRLLMERGQTVVFDGVGWTTPKLSSFLEGVSQRVPVWISARSQHSWDIGHIWPLLVRFTPLELHPFHLSETRALVEAAASSGVIPAAATAAIESLHRLSAGNPRVLRELLDGLAGGDYDPRKKLDLRRLNLDRRIRQLPSGTDFHIVQK